MRRARGFTLVELMVVVVIIGVLSFLAVAGYNRILKSSHVSEATEMVNGIRVAQETFHSETGQYADISTGIDVPNLYPAATPGAFKTTWGGACPQCKDAQGWKRLPVHADGPMLYGYATVAGVVGQALPTAPTTQATLTFPAATDLTSDWFIVVAKGDQDGNSKFCTVVAVSWNREIFIDQDGE